MAINVDTTRLVLQMSQDDSDAIKLEPQLATSAFTSFISFTELSARDMAGNLVFPSPVGSDNRLGCAFVADNVPPRIRSFTVDLHDRTLNLTFSEAVDASTLTVGGLALHERELIPRVRVPLAFPSGSTSPDGTVVVIGLSDGDFNRIAAETQVGTERPDTTLSASSAVISDLNGIPLARINDSYALLVTKHTPDRMSPRLVSYDTDMNTGRLLLTFSESVNLSSFRPTEITLFNSNNMPTGIQYRLTGGTSNFVAGSTTDVILTLSLDDLNNIKARPTLVTAPESTYLAATPSTILDMNSNMLVVVPPYDANRTLNFLPDQTRPNLDAFNLDLDRGEITLVFDETVNLTSLDIRHLQLQDRNRFSSSPHVLINATQITASLLYSTQVTLRISDGDLNIIKRSPLCSSIADCFAAVNLATQEFLISDMAANTINTIPDTSAKRVSNYSRDNTSPVLSTFSVFDLNAGQIHLMFSETVRAATVFEETLTFQRNFSLEAPGVSLTGGSHSLADSTGIVITLTLNDVNAIKLDTSLCVSTGSCAVRFNSSLLSDMADNPVTAVESSDTGSAYMPLSFVPDSTPPELTRFTLDMNTNVLELTFNEVVRANSLRVDSVTIQQSEFATGESVRLSHIGNPSTRSEDGLSMSVNLSISNSNALKAMFDMATTIANTWITHDSGLIMDVSGVPVAPRVSAVNATQASNVETDKLPPHAIAYTYFSLDNNTLRVLFDEPVDTSSLVFSQFELLSDPIHNMTNRSFYNPAERLPLTSGQPSYVDGTKLEVEILLTRGDARTIKRSQFLNGNISHLLIRPGAVRDPAENLIDASNFTYLLRPSGFVEDVTIPKLEQFNFDANLSRLLLTFSDLVDSSSVNPTALQLHSTDIGNGSLSLQSPVFPLISAQADFDYGIEIPLASVDLISIQMIMDLATNRDNIFISFNETLARDLSGRYVEEETDTSPFQATLFTIDTIGPRLVSFDLDLNAVPSLTLYFNEAVNPLRLTPSMLTLQQSNSSSEVPGGAASYRLISGVSSQNTTFNTTVRLLLSKYDANRIKATRNLATSSQDVYLLAMPSLIQDTFGNPSMAVRDGQAIANQNFTQDMIDPFVISYVMDLDVGQIQISFSEAVDPRSLDYSALELQNHQVRTNLTTITGLANGTIAVALNFAHTIIGVQLTRADRNKLTRSTYPIARNADSSFLVLPSNSFMDFASNFVEDINATFALRPVDYLEGM